MKFSSDCVGAILKEIRTQAAVRKWVEHTGTLSLKHLSPMWFYLRKVVLKLSLNTTLQLK